MVLHSETNAIHKKSTIVVFIYRMHSWEYFYDTTDIQRLLILYIKNNINKYNTIVYIRKNRAKYPILFRIYLIVLFAYPHYLPSY